TQSLSHRWTTRVTQQQRPVPFPPSRRRRPSPSTMPSSPAPKVWLISSATSPLGYSIALQALQYGDSVALGCRRNEVASDPAFHNPPPVPSSSTSTIQHPNNPDNNNNNNKPTDKNKDDHDDPTSDDTLLQTSISLSRLCAAFPSTAII